MSLWWKSSGHGHWLHESEQVRVTAPKTEAIVSLTQPLNHVQGLPSAVCHLLQVSHEVRPTLRPRLAQVRALDAGTPAARRKLPATLSTAASRLALCDAAHSAVIFCAVQTGMRLHRRGMQSDDGSPDDDRESCHGRAILP